MRSEECRNSVGIYDEAVFEAYKEAVNKIDTELVKDLPSSEQTAVDNAAAELENLKATLESKKYYTVTFKDVDGDGDVDNDDYQTAKLVGHDVYDYSEDQNYFFIANDIDENGIINVIDVFYIGRMKTV